MLPLKYLIKQKNAEDYFYGVTLAGIDVDKTISKSHSSKI